MGNHHTDHRERLLLLDKVKARYEPGPMRPKLCEVFEESGRTLPAPSYEWMYYAGMGDVDLMPATPEEIQAAKNLLAEGYLVPTQAENFYFGVKTLRHIKHFDDVKFGYDDKNRIVIFDFSAIEDVPDTVIRPDQTHDAAIALLKKRIEYKRAEVGAPSRFARE